MDLRISSARKTEIARPKCHPNMWLELSGSVDTIWPSRMSKPSISLDVISFKLPHDQATRALAFSKAMASHGQGGQGKAQRPRKGEIVGLGGCTNIRTAPAREPFE